jgi:hypothetical protein
VGHKLAELINYIIGAAILVAALFILKKKNEVEPGMKIYGFSFKTFSKVIYAGLVAMLLLIVITLLS